MPKGQIAGLGPLQSQVMEYFWTHGPATISALHERLTAAGREVGYTTVLVAVQKLEKKGWVKHRAQGRAYLYEARVSRHQDRSRSLRELLRNQFAGDVQSLVLQLLDDHPVSHEELRELRAMIDQRRKGLNDG